MKTCTRCGAEKRNTEFSKDKSRKDGLCCHCKACVSAAHAAWYARNPSKNTQRCREWRLANPERAEQTNKEVSARQRARDPEYHKARVRQFKKSNPAWCAENNAARSARKLRATPEWACPEELANTYTRARAAGLEVDHIVPLRSKVVCGLHVPHNLQLLPPAENKQKSNRYWPDMP